MVTLNVTFDDKCIKTLVYLKTDAIDQLLLSEGVCRQLGIIQYHPAAEPWRGKKRDLYQPPQSPAKVQVPRVTVNLVQALRLPSRKWVVVPVQVNHFLEDTLLFQGDRELQDQCGILMLDAILKPDHSGMAYVVAENHTGYTAVLEKDMTVTGESAVIIRPGEKTNKLVADVKAVWTEGEFDEQKVLV